MSNELWQHSLLYGGILSVAMVFIFLTLMYINPEVWVRDYPPDIQEKYGPMSARAERLRKLAGIPVVLLMVGAIFWANVDWMHRHEDGISFLEAFFITFVILALFNLVDLLILDWLIFVIIQPRRIVLPGTEGAAGYKDYAFHFRAFLKGIAGAVVAGLVVAGIMMLVQLL